MMGAVLPASTEFVLLLEPGLSPVSADPNQLHQVLMNLCMNAQQALHGRPGRIELGLSPVNLHANEVPGLPGLKPGPHVRLTVRDTGMGMSEEVQRQIFDPFFTTKAPGEGTGLGLAVVHGIVKGHEGAIRVRSQLGAGTTFEIFLPAIPGARPVPAPLQEQVTVSTGSRILIVDDDIPVAQILVKVLTKAGYHVSVHHRPQDALEEFTRNPAAFDLLISDHTMPVMTGFELIRSVRGLRQDLPTILITGLGDSWAKADIAAAGINLVVSKPFDLAAIVSSVEQLLRKARI
jgi:CheY-like chemotaxis protein